MVGRGNSITTHSTEVSVERSWKMNQTEETTRWQRPQRLPRGARKGFRVVVCLAAVISLLLDVEPRFVIMADAFSIKESSSSISLVGGIRVRHSFIQQSMSTGADEAHEDGWDVQPSAPSVKGVEGAWRYVKKPLLSIGGKGATPSHGNSLRQLLEAHTAVKVKVNARPFGGSLENAFNALRDLAEESGAPKGIEMVQARDGEHTIMFGMPGTIEGIELGTFPPPPPPPRPEREESDE
jgi:RNA-binding protein YhbY